jgi:Ca2+-binding RTX toxin-like protein
MSIGSGIPFSASRIICGRLIGNSNTDQIVVGGEQGIIVYDSKGYKLWDFDAGGHNIWEGQHQYMRGIYHLFISDLDSDGEAELIAGAGNKIFIFSNRGELIEEIFVGGIIKGFAVSGLCDNPSMDIADINNDGFQEIITVTAKGKLYIFGMQ